MPRGGARVGAGRPKGSLGKPPAAKADNRKEEPSLAYGRVVSKAGGVTRREERQNSLRGDEARHAAKRSRATKRLRSDRYGFGRKPNFVDDLALVAAEDDDAEDAFVATNPSARRDDKGDDVETRVCATDSADRLEAASRLAELRGRWEFAEVLAFLTAFRIELRAGTRRATRALGLRGTHWAAAPPTAAELERALADPEGKLAFPDASGFFEKAPTTDGAGDRPPGDGRIPDVEPMMTTAPNQARNTGLNETNAETPSVEPSNTETVTRERRRRKNAAVLARTHLALLFGVEPTTHVSDKPPSGGWSKRWPEWTARVSGERVLELFGRREKNAPFDRSAFETVVEEDVALETSAKIENRTADEEAKETTLNSKKPEKKRPEKKRRVVTRRSATEAYAAVTPTRRVRALWGLCEARLACDDIREKAASLTARAAGAVSLGADKDGRARWYVGREGREGRDDEDDDGDESDAVYDVVCGVARVCRAAPPRWDVYADEKPSEKRSEEPLFEPLSPTRVEADEASSTPDASPSPEARGEGDVSPLTTPSRGTLEYAERAIWADAARAEADAAARWAFVLEEEPKAASSSLDGSESSEDDDLSDLDSPSPKRRHRGRPGKKPARLKKRRETVEVRFARRARCDPRDVICSLASEGKWLEFSASKSFKLKELSRRAAETAVGGEKAVREMSDDGETLRARARPEADAKKKSARIMSRVDVPPYHRFAASFVSVPPLAVGDVSAAMVADADAMVRLDDIPCAWCGDASGESAFVLCDGCPNGGHLACLGLRGVPKNRWFCAVCADGGEGAETPRTRVVRRNGNKRPRAPREGAWETVAEECELWGGRLTGSREAAASEDASDGFGDGEYPGTKLTIETHASFAKLAYARASARQREATRRAAAATRAERAALDARRAERLALRDDDDFFDDDDDDDDDDERDSDNDTEDDEDDSDSERARRTKSTFVSEENGDGLVALGARPSRETDDAVDGSSRRQKTQTRLEKRNDVSQRRRGRLGTPATVFMMASEKENEPHSSARLCARCGDACFSLDDERGKEENDVGSSFAKCAFCPAEGHRFCVFGDLAGTIGNDEKACAVCAASKKHPDESFGGSVPEPLNVRAPPSPVTRRRFPRLVPSRVRDALESDDDDAWRFE